MKNTLSLPLFHLSIHLVNEIFLSTIAQGESDFDNTQQAQLESVADQCPITGGTAVFRARSLLALVGDYEYNDSTACESVRDRSSNFIDDVRKKPFVESLLLSPNPAQGTVTGHLPYPMSGIEVSLYDVLGKRVIAHTIEGKKVQQFSLNTEELTAGTYFCRVRSFEGTSFTETLIIKD